MSDSEIKTIIRQKFYHENWHSDPVKFTARGTERKQCAGKSKYPELCGIRARTAQYRTGYTRLWRARHGGRSKAK